jgi:hypothetical protein
MTFPPQSRGLYYPFHLCHERTLQQLLARYESVHFRDYMALQLTPMSGTTAYSDRMGGSHQDLVNAGRIVQGYSVSGPLDQESMQAVNRDLGDAAWRGLFHDALREDRRFQRGLFDLSHAVRIGESLVPGAATLLRLLEPARSARSYSVEELQACSQRPLTIEEGYDFEYALALVKTSAALVYTVRLCRRHGLEAVTDSAGHFRLLQRSSEREGLDLPNDCLSRDGY